MKRRKRDVYFDAIITIAFIAVVAFLFDVCSKGGC